MRLPTSAADSKPESKEHKIDEEKVIFAMVKGKPEYFTRREAFTLASMLIISLQVDCDAQKV